MNSSTRNIQSFIIPYNESNYIQNDVTEDNIYSKLNNIRTSLPKNAVLYTELKDHYQVFITDSNNVIKPIKNIITDDLNIIKSNITKQMNSLVSSAEQKVLQANATLEGMQQNIDDKIENFQNRINSIVSDLDESDRTLLLNISNSYVSYSYLTGKKYVQQSTLSSYVTTTKLNSYLGNYILKSDISNYIPNYDEIEERITSLENNISNYNAGGNNSSSSNTPISYIKFNDLDASLKPFIIYPIGNQQVTIKSLHENYISLQEQINNLPSQQPEQTTPEIENNSITFDKLAYEVQSYLIIKEDNEEDVTLSTLQSSYTNLYTKFESLATKFESLVNKYNTLLSYLGEGYSAYMYTDEEPI